MAEHEHARRIDARRLAQRVHRQHCIVGGFVVDAEIALGEVLRPRLGALLVAQHRDALRGESAGDVEEGLVRTDGFVAVLRAGAVHQHDRGNKLAGNLPIAIRHRQRAGQRAFAFADGEIGFVEVRIRGHGRRGWRRRGLDQETDDASIVRDHDLRHQLGLGVMQRDRRQLRAGRRFEHRFAATPGFTGLHGQRFPHRLQFFDGYGSGHLGAEHRFGLRVFAGVHVRE